MVVQSGASMAYVPWENKLPSTTSHTLSNIGRIFTKLFLYTFRQPVHVYLVEKHFSSLLGEALLLSAIYFVNKAHH